MIALTPHLTHWHWLCLSGLLLIAELLSGSGFLLCLAVAALCTGAYAAEYPTSNWHVQCVVYSITALITLSLWWLWQRRRAKLPSDAMRLNQRAQQCIGEVLTLTTPLQHGRGQVVMHDTLWTVTSTATLPAGASVRVVAVTGNLLHVVALDD